MSAVEPSDAQMDLVRMRHAIRHAIPALLIESKRALTDAQGERLAAIADDLRDSIEGDEERFTPEDTSQTACSYCGRRDHGDQYHRVHPISDDGGEL